MDGYLARPVENPLAESNQALKALALRSSPAGSEVDLKADKIRYVFVNWWMLDNEQQQKKHSL